MTSPGRPESQAFRSGFVPWGGVWRQSLRDAAPLAVGMLVVAAAAFLSAAVPMTVDVVATSGITAMCTGATRIAIN